MNNGDKLDAKLLSDYARQVGPDVDTLSASLESNRYAGQVKASAAVAGTIGISGTPSFVVGRSKGDMADGVKIVGAQPFASFDQKLKELQIYTR